MVDLEVDKEGLHEEVTILEGLNGRFFQDIWCFLPQLADNVSRIDLEIAIVAEVAELNRLYLDHRLKWIILGVEKEFILLLIAMRQSIILLIQYILKSVY